MADKQPDLCPFCGGAASVHNVALAFVGYVWEAWCTKCPALMRGTTRPKLLAAWNRRTDGK